MQNIHSSSSYLELFERNHITYDLLPDLTDEWLDRMDLWLLGRPDSFGEGAQVIETRGWN